jgi:hypothetical protein
MVPTDPASPPPENSEVKNALKAWKDYSKLLIQETGSLSEAKQLEYVTRIEQSSEAKLLAFECLIWLRKGKEAKKFRWLEEPMQRLLGGGAPFPNLALLGNPIMVSKWVNDQLKPLDTLSAWNGFFKSGQHLWLMHCLFQCRDKRNSLVEGLTALANNLAHWQNLQSPELWKKGGVQTTNTRWIAQMLESRLVAKFELSRSFVEQVYALSAVAEVSASARTELQAVWKQLDTTQREREDEVEARKAAEARAEDLGHKLEKTQDQLDRCLVELESEKQHTVRSGGFSEVARRETLQQVLSDVRQGLSHRLEDIRNYADREKPNREEIMELVNEIQTHLSKLESRLLQ